jgi:hypothetical protein
VLVMSVECVPSEPSHGRSSSAAAAAAAASPSSPALAGRPFARSNGVAARVGGSGAVKGARRHLVQRAGAEVRLRGRVEDGRQRAGRARHCARTRFECRSAVLTSPVVIGSRCARSSRLVSSLRGVQGMRSWLSATLFRPLLSDQAAQGQNGIATMLSHSRRGCCAGLRWRRRGGCVSAMLGGGMRDVSGVVSVRVRRASRGPRLLSQGVLSAAVRMRVVDSEDGGKKKRCLDNVSPAAAPFGQPKLLPQNKPRGKGCKLARQGGSAPAMGGGVARTQVLVRGL